MPIDFILAWRNIWRNRRRTLITVGGVLFAVVLSIFSQSLNRGSHEIMLDNMIRFGTGYLQLQDEAYRDEPSLDNSFTWEAATARRVAAAHPRTGQLLPRIETFMLAAGDQATRGSLVVGIDADAEQRFNGLTDRISAGRFFTPDKPEVVVGQGLARRLQLTTGDTLALIGQGRFGMSASGLFEIVGIIKHPLREQDDQIVYLPIDVARQLLSAEGQITTLLVAPERASETEAIATALRRTFKDDGIRVLTWPELMPELLNLLRLDMAGSYLLSGILYIVIGFGFYATVLTMTLERLREFGTLISLGMKRTRLIRVIFLETLSISLIGVAAGLTLAWLVLFYFRLYPIRLRGDLAATVIDMGWEPILPVSFAANIFFSQGVIVFVLALVISLYPLLKIIRLDILTAARS